METCAEVNFGHFVYSTSDGPDSSFADDFLEANSEEEEFACTCSPSSLMLASFTSFTKAVTLSAFERHDERRLKEDDISG